MIHTLAVVVGASRDDVNVYHHFGSTLGFNHHANVAVRLGLVETTEDWYELTPTGRRFLDAHPEVKGLRGRANSWDDELLADTLNDLETRWEGLIAD